MAANFGSLTELLVGRVISGIGSGLGMIVGPIYILEVAPTEMRGMMTTATFYNINIMGGVAGSYWINYASYEHISPEDSWQRRATLVLQLKGFCYYSLRWVSFLSTWQKVLVT